MAITSAPNRLVVLVVLSLVVAPSFAAWTTLVGDPSVYFRYQMPPGQFLYVISRFVGLLAFALLWLQAVLALGKGVPWFARRFRIDYRVHRLLGFVTFAAIAGHAGLFILATSLRAKHATLHWLVPQFGSGYYVLQVSLGSLALWLALAIVIAGLRRGRDILWRWLHRLWLPVFVLVYVHSTSIGSETRLSVLEWVYLFYAASFVVLLVAHLWCRLAGERRLTRV